MAIYLSDMVRRVEPYVPGEQPQDKRYIKLNTNESPYGPSPSVTKLIHEKEYEDLRLYPDPNGVKLKEAIARRNGLTKEEVFLSNGSDEALALCFMTFCDSSMPISFADRTYSFYPVWAKVFGVPANIVKLPDGIHVSVDDYMGGRGPVILCNPNAPTATALPTSEIERLLQDDPDRLIIVDEAYVDFGADSMVPFIHKYENLLVVQTYSKSRCLAGARLGFAMGQKPLIDALERIKNSFNSYTIDRFTLAMGQASMEDEAYFKETTGRVVATRERIAPILKELGFILTDSRSNFFWAKHETISGDYLYKALKDRGVLVRHFSAPELTDYLRITVGCDEEMDELVRNLRELVKA